MLRTVLCPTINYIHPIAPDPFFHPSKHTGKLLLRILGPLLQLLFLFRLPLLAHLPAHPLYDKHKTYDPERHLVVGKEMTGGRRDDDTVLK